MARIKINNGEWVYANTSGIPQMGVDYWNDTDKQEVFDYLDAQIGEVVERVSITLASDKGYDLTGLTVVFNNLTTGESESFTWDGTAISMVVPMGNQYNLSCNGKALVHTSVTTTTYTAMANNNREVVLELVYDPYKDLSMYDIYGNEISQTTANCYIVKEAGYYKFPLAYGNALKNGATNSAAYTKNSGSYSHDFVAHDGTVITTPYIEDLVGSASSVQLSIADTDGIFTNLSIANGSPCRYVQFEVANVPTTGANGVISIKNSDGTIMWNWHIWIWNENMTTIPITNATGVTYNILPYNLASKWDEDEKIHIKNYHYQFGRPNPILLPSAYNSNTEHDSYGELSYTYASIASNLQTGIQNPTTFYVCSADYNYNWFITNSGNTYNLWDANCTTSGASDNNVIKTVYDPSPIGFKIPNGNIFTGFSIISNADGIVKFTRYSGDTTGISIPASGYRNFSNASLYNVVSYGCVWSSAAVSQNHVYYLNFNVNRLLPQERDYRAYGFSVRPIEE